MATTTDEVKEILEGFYSIYYPSKLDTIDLILEKYKDSYDILLEQLNEKYKKDFAPIYKTYLENKKLKQINSSHVQEISHPVIIEIAIKNLFYYDCNL